MVTVTPNGDDDSSSPTAAPVRSSKRSRPDNPIRRQALVPLIKAEGLPPKWPKVLYPQRVSDTTRDGRGGDKTADSAEADSSRQTLPQKKTAWTGGRMQDLEHAWTFLTT